MEVFKEKELREYGVIPKKISRTIVKNTVLNYSEHYIKNHRYDHSFFSYLFNKKECDKVEEEINKAIELFVHSFTNDKEMKSILHFVCIDDIRKLMDNHLVTITSILHLDANKVSHNRILKELFLFRDYLLTKMIRNYKIVN